MILYSHHHHTKLSNLIIRYVIKKLLGKGTFGQVVLCENIDSKENVAIKIIKNKHSYFIQGLVEARMTSDLNANDINDEFHILRMKDYFVFRNHFCIVSQLLELCLYKKLKHRNYQGYTFNTTRYLTKQIIESLVFLAKNKIVHCDLKPENILLTS